MTASPPTVTHQPRPGGVRGWLDDRRYRRFMDRVLHTALTPPPPEAFGSFGKGSVIVPPTRIANPANIFIGAGVVIHEFVWLSVEVGRFEGITTALSIGDHVRIGRCTQISMCGEIVIGEQALISDQVLIADTFHEPHHELTPEDAPLARPQRTSIGAGAVIDLGAAILPGVTIGDNAYVNPGSVVTADVPPGAAVEGNPARLLDRPAPRRR